MDFKHNNKKLEGKFKKTGKELMGKVIFKGEFLVLYHIFDIILHIFNEN